VREQRITLDTVFTYGPNAAAQEPSKMGFKIGTQVTVDNALKMMLVHSANDMAVVLAEGVSGSIEKFSSEMNANAQRLGMTQTRYVNPNGLPADEQITSARDLAILARALIREFPEYEGYWHIGAIRFGKRIMPNTNRLLDAYPGTDGMKTGFICASGFNLVATATRDGKRLIAVVLGAPSSAARSVKAAELLERGFAQNPLSWLTPALGSVEALSPVEATPPNLHDEICGPHRKKPPADDEEDQAEGSADEPNGSFSTLLSALRAPARKGAALLSDQPRYRVDQIWREQRRFRSRMIGSAMPKSSRNRPRMAGSAPVQEKMDCSSSPTTNRLPVRADRSFTTPYCARHCACCLRARPR
jgi:D-alanyl-D-alanine carboxypeptidase